MKAAIEFSKILIKFISFAILWKGTVCDEIFGCGGFVKSNFVINYSKVEVKLYTKQGSLKYQTDCAPNNGYYLIPLYDKGDFILKIEPPTGWSFEPQSVSLHVDGVTDPCSQNQDINFVFKGFTVAGKVLSYGQNKGPAGINVALKTLNGSTLQATQTDMGGIYSFSSVLPDSYVIEATHDVWLFDQHTENIKINQDNVITNNKIILSGYDVRGNVFSEGEPIQGVHFLLFSESKVTKVLSGCNTDVVKGFTLKPNSHYVCHVTSSQDGTFYFSSVPTGQYTLIPFHKGEHIEFDVSPSEMRFKVEQQSYSFQQNFQVEGFSVSGQVLETVNGKGIEGAEIHVGNKFHTKSGPKGIYYLENMRAGLYQIKVTVPHIYFETVTMKVTPNTPHLPEIFASKFSVCGQLHIEQYPSGLHTVDRSVALKSSTDNMVLLISVQIDGEFCSIVSPGTYILEPVVSESEKISGLQFAPARQTITVTSQPLLDLAFTQFLAVVQGHVNCIERCNALMVELTSLTTDDVHLKTITTDEGGFTFKGCLPGKYSLTVIKDDWCFKSKSVDFIITDKDVSDIVLQQNGYQAVVILSHSSAFKVKYPSTEVHNIQLQRAKNILCLPESGIYEFIPIGCHLYKVDTFKFDTSDPLELELKPSKHLVTGSILTESNISDVKVLIQKHTASNPEVIPLEAPVEMRDNFFYYVFSTFVEPNTNLEVKVTSSKLLFRPSIAHVEVTDDCIDNAVEIVGKKGLFIEGSVSPALGNVKIYIKDTLKESVIAESVTNELGQFTVGPLDDESKYDVIAEKPGYFFTPEETFGNFKAYKLAEVNVEVLAENGSPLPAVLLSLSGGVDYRKNSFTQKDGKISFIGLSPGQYFLRSMMKEYQFNPSTKMIDIKEGTSIDIKISGKRVAYSLFGVINSLTGESEVGVAVEAVGIDKSCLQYQEEAISEQGGYFRIRGLQPNCRYSLHLKKGMDINQHIERAMPEETILKVTDGDITDARIIVFRHFGQLDVSGSVVTNQEHLPTLKARLYNEENPDQVLHTIPLGKSGFFFLPSMPIDNKFYILRLDSSLSSASYQYESPSVVFCANTSFYHFTFTFKPRPKTSEQEVSQGSLLTLPLALLIILIVYNHNKCIDIAMQTFQHITSLLGPVRMPMSPEHSSNENINARRKAKPRRT